MGVPTPPARCRYPIVLLHGLFGFVEISFGPLKLAYFRGVAPYLEAVGNRVIPIRVHSRQTIAFRANQIKEAIDFHPVLHDSPLNLVAHSMGGLDSRFLITHLGYGRRVRSLTTISTPHHGSFLADILGVVPGARRWAPAVSDLGEKAAERFNRKTPDWPETHYFSIPAKTRFIQCCPFLWIPYFILVLRSGPNDGQVPLSSSRWGEVLEEAEADHIQLLGMRYGLNAFRRWRHLDLYGRISHVLAAHGC